jgi:hypothetical protein
LTTADMLRAPQAGASRSRRATGETFAVGSIRIPSGLPDGVPILAEPVS